MDFGKIMYFSGYKAIKKKSKELLLSGNNYLAFIIALIVSVAMSVIPIYIFSYVSELSEGLAVDFSVVLLLALELFIAMPIFTGLIRMFMLSVNRIEFCFADLFYAFTTAKRYFNFLMIDLITYIAISTPFAISAAGYSILKVVFLNANLSETSIVGMSTAISVFLGLLFLPLSCRFYPFAYFAFRDESGIIKALKNSWHTTKKMMMNIVGFQLSFVLMIFLTALPMCLPLIFYTVPNMICAYGIFCENLELLYKENSYKCQNKIRSEESTETLPKASVEGINE